MAAAAGAISSLSAIVTPSSSSSTSLTPLPSDHFHSFTHFSPKPSKHLHKSLFLKPSNFNTTPLPFLFPFHLCHSSSAFGDIESSDISGDDEVQDSEIDETDVEENDVRSSDGGRVYVGNLPFSMTSSQLSEIFSRAGQIKSVEIIHDKMTDRSRGFGFVTMESVEEAKEVIRMFDGSEVGGRTIRVNFPEVPKGGERKMMGAKIRISNQSFVDTPHKIYAGNLGWGVTTQGLRDAFSNQAGFSSAKVVYERDSGRSRGFGFVSFQSAEDAQSAISDMNGVELEGRPLRLNMATDRSRSNAAAATGQSENHRNPNNEETISAMDV
ncbi:33 kDa ribonucleoprotein, chloroplastic-like [Silene latifolia]|uniref:33 kDa ribonucleoprotein, chloroplastic-like n=1 Tax=Silene latifolia TaxID=37657 RepID=UPI003D76F7AD